MKYKVYYEVAGRSGTRTVKADDQEDAMEKVKTWTNRNIYPICIRDTFRIIEEDETIDNED